MESRAKYATVGAAVVLFSVLFAAVLLWLSNIGDYESYDYYTVYFKNQTLDGLQQDSDVTMKGVKVGSVERFEISPEDIERVKVTLRIATATPVKTDTRAVVRRNLLTGLAAIDLRGSSRVARPLTKVAGGEDYPVIAEGRGDFDAISSSLPGFLEDAAGLMQRANLVLSDENIQHVNRSLANLDRMSSSLAEGSADLRETAKNFNRISGSLARFSDNADKFVLDGGADFRRALQQMEKTAANIDRRTDEVSKSVKGTVNVLALDFAHMSQEVTAAAQILSATVEKFDEPQTILAGPNKAALGPGETAAENGTTRRGR